MEYLINERNQEFSKIMLMLLNSNFENLFLDITREKDNYFYYDKYYIEGYKIRHHLPLLSVILHFLKCKRNCDGASKSNYCFFFVLP